MWGGGGKAEVEGKGQRVSLTGGLKKTGGVYSFGGGLGLDEMGLGAVLWTRPKQGKGGLFNIMLRVHLVY